MNYPKPLANRANSILISIHALIAAAVLVGCGREQPKPIKNIEPIASETPVVPVAAVRDDANSTGGVEPSQATVVQPSPSATNTTAAVSPRPIPVASPAKDYVVVKGDTWFKIARTHGVKFSALTNANSTASRSTLKVGQKIQIPTAASPAVAGIGFKEPGNPADAGNMHVVKAGETLTQIAKQNHTTVKALQAANGLKTTRLLVGQKLRLVSAAQPTA
jgi:LysM repeat protein